MSSWRSAPIRSGSVPGLFDPALILPYLKARRVAVVTNDVVGPLYLDPFVAGLRPRASGDQIVLPDGEAHKDWPTLNLIFDGLLAARLTGTPDRPGWRRGGRHGGFAAATYQRGVPFIQVPTHCCPRWIRRSEARPPSITPLGKNMIGAFYQPKLVLADTTVLDTLPDRELKEGLAEVIKYGLIRDLPFLEWIEAHLDRLLARDPEALAEAVERSCRNKAEVVAADETEQGERATLNLGHTFGHAIETGLGYGQWLHGEAVAAGTIMAADLSRRLGWLTDDEVARVKLIHAGRATRDRPGAWR